jgi:hypothetical protein
MPRLSARSLKATVVLNAEELAALGTPAAPRVLLTIVVPEYGDIIADVAAKSLRKAQAVIADAGADNVACVLQGKLTSGGKIAEAGLAIEMIKGPVRVKGKLAPSVEELKDIDYQYDEDVKGG